MVYVNVRHSVADYEKWRPIFDGDAARRKAAGATGAGQVYRDVDDPNTITVILEWDNEKNARKFMEDPSMPEVMQKSGVTGMPVVRAIQSRA